MGKRRQKPLLAEQGILHLKSCFVQPSEESGLLTTVGGRQEQPLVLASGNYGYGIPVSVAIKNAEDAQSKADEEQDPDVQMVREINGGVYSANELTKDRSGASAVINAEEMSVAELVRSIGGARDAPLRGCDVVEDRADKLNKKNQEDDEDVEDKGPDPEADEFYASLGIKNPNEKIVSPPEAEGQGNSEEKTNRENINPNDPNVTDGIRDFYKSYTKYYYSNEPDPYSDQRLEFGVPIEKDENFGSNDGGEQTIIQLARMAQIRARQAQAAADALEKAKKAKGLNSEKGPNDVAETEAEIYDPLPMEVVPSGIAEELGITVDTTFDQYWEFVKDDPHDFNRWIYLIHYAESTNNIISCRKVYSAFLPLFSYCFGYWKRYSDMEKRFNYFGRALTILERGLEFIPLSVELWLTYIELFCEINAHSENFESIVRDQYEKALNTCGMEFRSDKLWDTFIDWETNKKKLKRAFTLYGRILQVPTRLFNRHWDNVQALVRDHHPRDFLEKDEYEYLRKKGCRKFGFKYKEEPEYEHGEIRKPSKPEDQLMVFVKETILKKLTKVHDKCVIEAEKRWVYEDNIKRPYFHTKALDRKQLRNWEEYLNFEISEGDHDRIVLLFERCVISCALYENFWSKYARYLESYHKKNPSSNRELSTHFLKNQENLEIGSTKETEEEEKRIDDVQFVINHMINELENDEEKELAEIKSVLTNVISKVVLNEVKENQVTCGILNSVIAQVVGGNNKDFTSMDLSKLSSRFIDLAQDYANKVASVGYIVATEELRKELISPKLSGDSDSSGLPVKSGELTNNIKSDSSPGFKTLLSVPEFPPAKYAWQDAVRDVYKRACVVHCPKKPAIRLQWAAFEEELGNSKQALELIRHAQLWFPDHLGCKMYMIELERRRGNHEAVIELFEKFLVSCKSKDEYSVMCMKYARFLHKELKKPDKALKILKNAVKKDKSNPRLFSYVFEICYEKYPTDKRAAFAALELALNCKDLSEEQKLIFLKKKMYYLQEHGDIKRYRDTLQQLTELQEIARKKETKELLRKEEEARLSAGTVNPYLMPFPVPDWSAVQQSSGQKVVPIEFEPMDQTATMNARVEEMQKEQDEAEASTLRKVAPPEELNLSSYGYSSKHPDYKLAENMAQKEYEQLELKGYPTHLKDTEEDRISRKRKAVDDDGPIYIVQPKKATMYLSCEAVAASTASAIASIPAIVGGKEPTVIELEAPQRLSAVAVPSTSPCINVPEWFIKEGGELCLSESRAGFSVLRYWPHFLNDLGQSKMFKAVRRSVKWHQKQRVVWGQWRYIPRLVSWLGPCEWADRGLELSKNEDWPPEILDLLHRINQLTQHEFNSCFMNLYRTGHDSHPWHGDIHPAYGANPPVATISLGALRLFEMKRRGPVHNFIRFPLFPGSLLIMEGACQVDWSHQIPKDPKVEGERISLVFRVMHAIEPKDGDSLVKSIEDSRKSEDESDGEPIVSALSANKEPLGTREKQKDLDKASKSSPETPSSLPTESNGIADEPPEIEIIEVIEPPPNPTKIIFHNKKK